MFGSFWIHICENKFKPAWIPKTWAETKDLNHSKSILFFSSCFTYRFPTSTVKHRPNIPSPRLAMRCVVSRLPCGRRWKTSMGRMQLRRMEFEEKAYPRRNGSAVPGGELLVVDRFQQREWPHNIPDWWGFKCNDYIATPIQVISCAPPSGVLVGSSKTDFPFWMGSGSCQWGDWWVNVWFEHVGVRMLRMLMMVSWWSDDGVRRIIPKSPNNSGEFWHSA